MHDRKCWVKVSPELGEERKSYIKGAMHLTVSEGLQISILAFAKELSFVIMGLSTKHSIIPGLFCRACSYCL